MFKNFTSAILSQQVHGLRWILQRDLPSNAEELAVSMRTAGWHLIAPRSWKSGSGLAIQISDDPQDETKGAIEVMGMHLGDFVVIRQCHHIHEIDAMIGNLEDETQAWLDSLDGPDDDDEAECSDFGVSEQDHAFARDYAMSYERDTLPREE